MGSRRRDLYSALHHSSALQRRPDAAGAADLLHQPHLQEQRIERSRADRGRAGIRPQGGAHFRAGEGLYRAGGQEGGVADCDQSDRRLNSRMIRSHKTRAISENPEIGFAGSGGTAGIGPGGIDATTEVAAGAWPFPSWAFRLLANWVMICAAVACTTPTPRPYCATAPESARSVCTSTLEPVPAGSSRKVAAALAPPRPLASVPSAFTRARRLLSSTSSNASATGPSRTAILPL